MDFTRRRLLAASGTLGVFPLTGCSALDFASGNDTLSFEAARAIATEPTVVNEDVVTCFGVHPRQIDDTDAINRLLGGVEHTD